MDAFYNINTAYFHSRDSDQNSVSYLCFGEGNKFCSYKANALDNLQIFLNENKGKFIYGYVGYDIKNEIEHLNSENEDNLGFPLYYFHCPKNVFVLEENCVSQIQGKYRRRHTRFINSFLRELKYPILGNCKPFQSRISKENYVKTASKLKDHIQRGDIYEVNFCQEYFSTDNARIFPLSLYSRINSATKSPFSCYLQHDQKYILCCSPERFIKKQGTTLISQPIKGTAARGNDPNADKKLKTELKNSIKEQSENIMIVDLVRNDLSKIAKKGSVKVDELLGLYSFETVHQLISTVSCELYPETTFTDILRATFPMGSMTGCPKVSAMQLIEQYESFRRGLYSGTIGYFLPNGDFDFNVVIRTVLYNYQKKYMSCGVGGAITINSDPLAEYDECEVKVRKLLELLTNN